MKIYRKGRAVREAILHCAAVHGDFHKFHSAASARDEIRRWHASRGFSDIGYHFVVMPDGEYCSGRPVEIAGAHVAGHNANTLGVLMVERATIRRLADFDTYFTDGQAASVREILRRYEIEVVTGHNDYAPKLCPGFKVDSRDWVL